MKYLFCFLVLAATMCAGDYSETQLLKHVQIGDDHAYLYYNWKIDKFFALLSHEEQERPANVEELIDNCFLMSFKAAKTAFPGIRKQKENYGTYSEDEYEMLFKNSVDSVTELTEEEAETES